MHSSLPQWICRRASACTLVLSVLTCPDFLQAGDWPQILGPTRNGIAASDETLLPDWPTNGPKIRWERSVGDSYSGLAVSDGQGYLYHRINDLDWLEAIDPATGKTLWKHSDPTSFSPGVGSGEGPLCVPTVMGKTVLTYSAQGLLTARQTKNGALLWQRATHKDFRALEGYFGAGNTPLVAGDVVIVNVGGGRTEAGIVGFDLKTGETLWTRTSEQASYSAPVLWTNDGITSVIVITRLKCVALDPVSGELRWEIPFGQRGPTVNAALPVPVKSRLYLTASYGIGGHLILPATHTADSVWSDDDTLSSQYATPIEDQGLLYGFHGRDDHPPSELRCIDPFARTADSRVRWSVPGIAYGTLIKADGKLIVAQTDGQLTLAEISNTRFDSKGSFKAFPGTIRALPALSNGGLFVRDEQTLKCFEVGPTSQK